MVFNKESDFEEALIELLSKKGWEPEVLKNPTEEDLINNWANILFDNNRGIDRLNDFDSAGVRMPTGQGGVFRCNSAILTMQGGNT